MLLSAKPPCQPLAHPLTVDCQAPAKLILTGEHAVLHQQPAISLPIPLYSHCQMQLSPLAPETTLPQLRIELSDLKQTTSLSWQALVARSDRLRQNYQAFLTDQLAINAVLETPFDLILLGIFHFAEHAALPKANIHLQLRSDIPMERGLGSSASIIVALIKALETASKTRLNPQQGLALAQQIENYQHGRSSGVDTATISLQQSLCYQQGRWSPLNLGALPSPLKAWLIDSGKAFSSTGDVVTTVAKHFTGNAIWQDFGEVCNQIEQAWQSQQASELLKYIKHNQALLEQIGVVPKSVADLCHQLVKQLGGAAKVCGAGSLDWQTQADTQSADLNPTLNPALNPTLNPNLGAGIVLYLGEQSPEKFCRAHNWPVYPIQL